MKDNKVVVLTLLFFLLCASLIGGVWFLDKRVRELQAQYDELEQRRVDLTSATEALMEQKKVFTEAFNELDNYHVNVASDDMDFYANVQQAVQDKGVEILSTRQQGVNAEGVGTIAMTLRGDYYDMVQVLAAWRGLPMTVRVVNLTVRQNENRNSSDSKNAPLGRVEADVTVEAIVAANNSRR